MATADRLRQITEDRSTRRTGENNAGIAAFHDAVGTFRAIENLVRCLGRYSVCVLTVAP